MDSKKNTIVYVRIWEKKSNIQKWKHQYTPQNLTSVDLDIYLILGIGTISVCEKQKNV